MEVILWIFIVAEGLATLAGIGLLFTRRKYLEQLRSLPEQRAWMVLESSRKIVKTIRILYWASPIYIILIPLAIYYTLGEKWFVFALTILALMYLMTIPMYISRSWLLRDFSRSDGARDGMDRKPD
jgi:hypothetical protein